MVHQLEISVISYFFVTDASGLKNGKNVSLANVSLRMELKDDVTVSTN